MSSTKRVLMFLVHQFIVILALRMIAGVLTASALNALRLLGWALPRKYLFLALTGTPYFPLQIALGLFMGWLLARLLRDHGMVWVWVPSFLAMCYSLIALPTATASMARNSRFSHFFGWGCRPENHCFDQVVFTLALYTAVAYSIGAVLAEKMSQRFRPVLRRPLKTALTVGVVFCGMAIYDLIVSVQGAGWQWMIFAAEAVPAAMGVYLVFLGLGLKKKTAVG